MLVSGDTLATIAAFTGLSPVVGLEALNDEAETIGDAFRWYVVAQQMHGRDSADGVKAQWCASVARQAHELRVALGYLGDERTGGGAHFRDGMQILASSLHGNIARDLERIAWRIEPERMKAAKEKSEQGVQAVWWHFAGERLPAGLRALELMAQHSAAAYAARVKRGGRGADGSWWELFSNLAGSYNRQFGTMPSVAQVIPNEGSERDNIPSGPALEWFAQLFRHVQTKARELGRTAGGGGVLQDNELAPGYGLLLAAAARALKPAPADALARAIRRGVKLWHSRPPPEPSADFTPIDLDAIFDRSR